MLRLRYGTLRVANTLIAVFSNLLLIACWFNNYSVKEYALLAPWLVVITFCSAVDLGIGSVAYADARRLFLQGRRFDAERRLSSWLIISVYVTLTYITVIGSLILLFGPLEIGVRLLLVGLLIGLVLNIPWRLIVSRGTALADPEPAEILDVGRKLVQMIAWAVGVILGSVITAVFLILITWLLFVPFGLIVSKRWNVIKKRVSISHIVLLSSSSKRLMRSGIFVFVDQLASTVIVVALGFFYPGAAIVATADLAARLVRAASSGWWMFASVMLPDITRFYWTGRDALMRSINAFLGCAGLLGAILGGGLGALFGPLLLSQFLGGNVPFLKYEYVFLFSAMGASVLQAFSTCWTLAVGGFSNALRASILSLFVSIASTSILVGGFFSSSVMLVSINLFSSAVIGFGTWLYLQREYYRRPARVVI